MPYINSRGEVVQNREWSWDSPVVAIISFFNVIRLFFVTMFGASEPDNKKSDGQRRGGFGPGGFGSGGGGGGGGGSGGGAGGGGGAPRSGVRGGFATMSDIRPPPASSPCAGGSCPR